MVIMLFPLTITEMGFVINFRPMLLFLTNFVLKVSLLENKQIFILEKYSTFYIRLNWF